MKAKHFNASVWSAFAVGALFGAFAACSSPEPEPVVIEEVVYRDREVEVQVETPYVPESCRWALDKAHEYYAITEDFHAVAGEQMSILRDAGVAIATENEQRIQELQDQQFALVEAPDSDMMWFTDSSIKLWESLGMWVKTCEEELQ